MLIKNTTVVSFDDLSILESVDVKIRGNLIQSIEKIDEVDNETIDGSRYVLMPGLTNAHAHTAMALLRGAAEDTTSTEWFNEHIWIYEKNIDKGDVYIGTLLGGAEMIASGITTVFDHYFNMDEAYRAYTELGMRADLSYTMFGAGEGADKNFDEAMNFIENFLDKSDLITLSLGPHSPYVCPKQFLERIAKIQSETHLKVHLHISEEPWQVEKSIKEFGLTPIKYIDSIGLLNENTILAHAYFATDEELELIKKKNANIAHAPKTYLRFAWVNDLLPKALEKDVNITFATDGAASNANYSIIEAGRLSAILGKVATNSPKIAKFEEVVRLFSLGERFLKKPIGKIKPNYLADIVFLDKYSPRLNPQDNIFANLLYALSEQDIKKVMVNGKFVYEGGKILGVNMEDIIKEANKISKRLRVKKSEKPLQNFG